MILELLARTGPHTSDVTLTWERSEVVLERLRGNVTAIERVEDIVRDIRSQMQVVFKDDPRSLMTQISRVPLTEVLSPDGKRVLKHDRGVAAYALEDGVLTCASIERDQEIEWDNFVEVDLDRCDPELVLLAEEVRRRFEQTPADSLR